MTFSSKNINEKAQRTSENNEWHSCNYWQMKNKNNWENCLGSKESKRPLMTFMPSMSRYNGLQFPFISQM